MTSIRRNIVANYIGRAWPALLAILLVPLYIDFIGVEAYGLVGFFTTLSSVMGILDLGIGSTMNRELARRSAIKGIYNTQRDVVKTLEVIYWTIAVIAGLFVVFLAPTIANSWIRAESLDNITVLRSIQYMGISIALRFPMSLYEGGLMGLQKQVLVNKILIIIGTFRGGGAILVLWLISPTIEAFFIWQIIISLLGSVIFLFALWFSLPPEKNKAKFKINILKEIWGYAAAVSANAIIGIAITQLDKIILSKMLSLKMFAYYSIAATVASSLWMIIIPFNNAIFPKLVELYEKNQKEKLIALFHNSSQLISFLLVPVSCVLIVSSKDILYIWTKDMLIAENSYIILSLLVFGTLLNGLATLPAKSSSAFGWPMLITYTNLIQAIIIVPLIVLMVNLFGGKGAAISWVILNSTYVLIMSPIFFKRYMKDELKIWFMDYTLKPLILGFLISFLVYYFFSPIDMIGKLLKIILTGFLVLVSMGLILPLLKKEIINITKRIK